MKNTRLPTVEINPYQLSLKALSRNLDHDLRLNGATTQSGVDDISSNTDCIPKHLV